MAKKLVETKNYVAYFFSLLLISIVIYKTGVISSVTVRQLYSNPVIKNNVLFLIDSFNENQNQKLPKTVLSNLTVNRSYYVTNATRTLNVNNRISDSEITTVNEVKALNCSEIHKLLSSRGFSESDCLGRLGNQLGVVALGLAINLQFGNILGTTIVFLKPQNFC